MRQRRTARRRIQTALFSFTASQEAIGDCRHHRFVVQNKSSAEQHEISGMVDCQSPAAAAERIRRMR
jgi:hypothetical protein